MDQGQAFQDILETVHFLRDHAVSKEDAKAFATKEDLKAFATKEDLKAFATKEDLKAFGLRMEQRFATKEDLERFATEEHFEKMKDEIMTHLDGLVVLHKKLDEERVAMQANFDRLTGQVRLLAKHVHVQLDGV